MADELKLRRDMDRQAKAQALLDNDLLKEAFAGLEKELMDLWRMLPNSAHDERERIWWAVKANDRAQSALRSIIDNGKIAAKELEHLLGRKQA